jgi:NADH-quinone oxidoreductase subunit M
MVKRVFYGEIANPHVADLKDLNRREFLILAVLAVMVIGLGVYPKLITDFTHVSAAQWLSHMVTSKLPVPGI